MPRKGADLKIEEEISSLNNKLSDAELHLKEEKKINLRLIYDLDVKSQQINRMMGEIDELEAVCAKAYKDQLSELKQTDEAHNKRCLIYS